ncbi:MAG: homoserine kinase [Nakamurella sp.]
MTRPAPLRAPTPESMAGPGEGWVAVSVPATSANLGPGYDSLGLALDKRDVVWGRRSDSGVRIEVQGCGASTVPRTADNLVHRSAQRALAALDEPLADLELLCHNMIPHGGGQGSSAAAIVAGLAVGRALVPDGSMRMSDGDLLDIAAGIEGHPDNAAPAVLGGFTLSWIEESGRTRVVRPVVHPEVSVLLFSADRGASTEMARTLLPDTVPHRDAAMNSRTSALLMYALGHAPELLFEATHDWLHQRYRASAMRPTADLVLRLRDAGFAATVSGAGPSVLVLLDPRSRRDFDRDAWQVDGFEVETLAVDTRGLVVGPGAQA